MYNSAYVTNKKCMKFLENLGIRRKTDREKELERYARVKVSGAPRRLRRTHATEERERRRNNPRKYNPGTWS